MTTKAAKEKETVKVDRRYSGILLHPTSATNAAIMGRLLDEWQKQGYRFGSLYELTGNAV